jgi:hypothetical protein
MMDASGCQPQGSPCSPPNIDCCTGGYCTNNGTGGGYCSGMACGMSTASCSSSTDCCFGLNCIFVSRHLGDGSASPYGGASGSSSGIGPPDSGAVTGTCM